MAIWQEGCGIILKADMLKSEKIFKAIRIFFTKGRTNSLGVCGPVTKTYPEIMSNLEFSKGKNNIKFIVSVIIFAALLLAHLTSTVSQTTGSAGSLSPADPGINPGSPVNISDSRTGLSSESSSSLDRTIYDGSKKIEVPDTEELLDSIIDKIWQVESRRRLNPPAGDGGKAVGPLQIHQCVLDDVNKFWGKDYRSEDRNDLQKSKLIAKLYIQMWLHRSDEEIAVRIFNGGPRGWRNNATDEYWKNYLKLKNEN